MSELDNDKGFLAGNFSDFGAQASSESWQTIASNLPAQKKSNKRGLFFLISGITCFILAYFSFQFFLNPVISFSKLSSTKLPVNNTEVSTKKTTSFSHERKPNDAKEFIPITLDNFTLPYYLPFNSSENQLPFCNSIYPSDSRFVYAYIASENSEINSLKAKKLERQAISIPKTDLNSLKKRAQYIKLQSAFYADIEKPKDLIDSMNMTLSERLDVRSQLELSYHLELNYRFTIGIGVKYGRFENQFSSRSISYINPYKKIESFGISIQPEWTFFKTNRFDLSSQFSVDFNHYFNETTTVMNSQEPLSIVDNFTTTNTNTTHQKIAFQSIGYSFGLSANYWLNQRLKMHISPQISDQFHLNKQNNSVYQIQKLKFGAQLGLSFHF